MKFLPAFIFVSLFFFGDEIILAQNITTFAGNGSSASILGQVGDGGLAAYANIAAPTSMAFDSKGNLYIASVNMIRKVAASSNIISTIAGTGIYGSSGDGGFAVNANLGYVYTICMDAQDNIYFTENGGHRIRKINQGGIITTVAGTGGRGFSGDGALAINATINAPRGICIDDKGNIYFCDSDNSRIRKIDAVTGFISSISGNGSVTSSGDGGQAINAGTPYPVDVKFDKKGALLFTEVSIGNSCRLRKIDLQSGLISTLAGNDKNGYSGDGGLAVNAGLYDPTGICIDNNNNIYISEFDDSRIRKIDAATGIISTVAGNGSNGFSGDNGLATSASLYGPVGLCFDGASNLFIADNKNNRIRKIGQLIPNICAPDVTISTASASVCQGSAVSFTAFVVNGGNAATYQWFINGNAVYTGWQVFSTNVLNDKDVINCIYSSTAGCVVTVPSNNSITMNVHALPVINLAKDTVVYLGNKLLLNATVISADTVTYLWTPNVWLDSDTLLNPTASPQTNISYQLQVSSSVNCTASASINVLLLNIKIPNAFSPNGDNINDKWIIDGLIDYKNCSVEVFSRSGQIVFHSIGYNQPWDGTRNGKPLPMGTYYYFIDPKNGIPPFSGAITILR